MNGRIKEIVKQFENRKQGIINENAMRHYAIFLPLLELENDIHLLFEVRAKHMKRQPGEVCFPGGMVDSSDSTPADAAVRELCEEIGIQKNHATIIGSLDKIISPFKQIIFPYVGYIEENAAYSPNEAEVEELFTVPLSYFLDNEPIQHNIHLKMEAPDSFPYDRIPNGKNYKWNTITLPEHFYYYEDYVIWGLTAQITKHFIEEAIK
ncbi:8-oxo-dGTP pyrophosphatase MutT (NUDIX family) [Salibacterium salarium]|uniref:NUDIX hydrolase n=1 Tax=Salibacterium salarium TaxID=284579 RepID=UPI00277EEF38|nr:CoA pyrophosphatase [Salibacterium salarium]MDQ0299800.1 8-oxo-dGTP pyrophosphatase MutT (NUDIX family) [Salibacterium salarium]